MLLELVGVRCLGAHLSQLLYSALHVRALQVGQVQRELHHARNFAANIVTQVLKSAKVHGVPLLLEYVAAEVVVVLLYHVGNLPEPPIKPLGVVFRVVVLHLSAVTHRLEHRGHGNDHIKWIPHHAQDLV